MEVGRDRSQTLALLLGWRWGCRRRRGHPQEDRTRGCRVGAVQRAWGEQSGAWLRSQPRGAHLAAAPAYLAAHLVLMRGSCGSAPGSHLFCFQHQRAEERPSSPEGHGHPSCGLHCQEAGSPRPMPAPPRVRSSSPLPSRISWPRPWKFPLRPGCPRPASTAHLGGGDERAARAHAGHARVTPKHVKFYFTADQEPLSKRIRE